VSVVPPLIPTIGSELDGAPSLFSVAFDLPSVGYRVHEHFAIGTANSYSRDAEPKSEAAYVTRLVVYCPADPGRANGTTIIEWLNVTGGLDIAAVWMATHRHLVRDGYTWVGVTAQSVGIEGGGVMPGLGLRNEAPERYGTLAHPGDAFSFDIFTQVARAARDLLPDRYGVTVDRVIATGASQSAFYLTTYINVLDARLAAVDAFLLQGRAGAGAPIAGWDLDVEFEERRRSLVGREQIRADARVPVMVVQSETDVFGALAYLPARQPDGDRFRLWEVAGAAHCDTYFLCAAALDSGSLPSAELAALIDRADSSGIPTDVPINAGPQMHFVLQRAIDAVDQWIRNGALPPSAARLGVDADNELARDAFGIARGGVRTPWVDAPLVALSGLGQPGLMTELFGTTRPIAPELLDARYPNGRVDYVAQFRAATHTAVEGGFVLRADVAEIEGLGDAAWA
jgi:hypothetical protein